MVEKNSQRKVKGLVQVTADKGRLRLRWTVAGERYNLYLKFADTPENRKLAISKATQIEWDIKSDNFDPTLRKYRPQPKEPAIKAEKVATISVVKLFQEFSDYRASALDERTLEKYAALETRLVQFFKGRAADSVTQSDAEAFIKFLKKFQQVRTIKDRLTILIACWRWGMKGKRVSDNPWKEVQHLLKASPRQQPKPFSRSEISAIVTAFTDSEYYSHYANYVRFLFATGCRTGEAIGLRWRHISEDFSSIWIGESITRGRQKGTKTNKDRVFPCNQKLTAFLAEIKPDSAQPDDLVFPAPEGGPIDDNNFRDRAWRKILSSQGIPYRKPYNTRHSFVSHCLAQRMNPVEVASITGHDIGVLYRNYAGLVVSRPQVPDIF